MRKIVNIKNHGFIMPVQTSDNYILGGLGLGKKDILCPSRDWTPFLPSGELQIRTIETSSCTEFGTLNGIEILERRLWQINSNYSERLVSIGAKNTEIGNDPHTVAEWIRKNGLVNEKLLPFTDEIQSWKEYMTPNPLTNDLIAEAKKWLKTHSFRHEYVFTGGKLHSKQEKLLEVLKYSPIGVSVRAWERKGDLYVKEPGELDTHWVILAKGKEKKPWTIYDSYEDDGEPFIKELDWNYDFGIAKLFVLKLIDQKSRWQRFLQFLKNWD